MWRRIWLGRKQCIKAEQWFEEATGRLSEAPAAEELLASLEPSQRDHVRECGECQNALKDLLESRVLLAALKEPETENRPFFSRRVMAAIAAREMELERATRAWAVVPRLASRFAGIATVLLLIGGALVYEGPLHKQANQTTQTAQPAAESGTQLFEDNAAVPANRDDVLVSLLERGE